MKDTFVSHKICWYIAIPWFCSFAKLTNGHLSVVSGLQEFNVVPVPFQWALFFGCYSCLYMFSFLFFILMIRMIFPFDQDYYGCKFYFCKVPIWQIFVQIFRLCKSWTLINHWLYKTFSNDSSVISNKRYNTRDLFVCAVAVKTQIFGQLIGSKNTINIFSF